MAKTKIDRIIFIIADTLRAKNIGLYNPRAKATPNIDALGKTGVSFHNAYASITSTDPSITSIMSGLYPLSIRLLNHAANVSSDEEKYAYNTVTLAEILKSKGFKTVALDWLSRWHKKGYDYYSGKIIKDMHFSFGNSTPFSGPFPLLFRVLDKITIKLLRRDFFIRFYYAFLPDPKIPYDPADTIINKAIEIIKRNKKSQLFLYLHFWDAHAPHTRPKGLKSYLLNSVDDTYNAEISFLDLEVGHLLSFLESTDLLDKTLIIFTADHGENLYENGIAFNHENLYENVVKVPLILKHPSLGQKQINAFVQHVDIFPTILDILGIPVGDKIDGENLMPLMLGKTKKVREFLYFEDLTHRKIELPKITRRRGIRIGKYKYIQSFRGKNKELYTASSMENFPIVHEELYDLKSDPQEKKNIRTRKPQIVKKLKKKLEDIVFDLNIKRFEKDLNENSRPNNISTLF